MKEIKKEDKYNIGELDFQNSISTTDCTGLIPSSPVTQDEYDSYNDIYSFQPPNISAKTDELKNPISKMSDK